MDKFSSIRSSIREAHRKLKLDNRNKTPKELGMDEKFEDDPRALKEIEYGRVVRRPTTNLGGGSTLGSIEFEDKKWS